MIVAVTFVAVVFVAAIVAVLFVAVICVFYFVAPKTGASGSDGQTLPEAPAGQPM